MLCTVIRALAKESIRGGHVTPIIKVHDIAWLEFEKADLARAEVFARAFGFGTALRSADKLCLRGADSGSPCVLIRRGRRSRFVGAAYVAQDQSDVLRLAEATGTRIRALPESLGGVAADQVDPSGVTVRVVHGTQRCPAREFTSRTGWPRTTLAGSILAGRHRDGIAVSADVAGLGIARVISDHTCNYVPNRHVSDVPTRNRQLNYQSDKISAFLHACRNSPNLSVSDRSHLGVINSVSVADSH